MFGSKVTQSRPHTMMIRKLSELLVSSNSRPASGGSDSSPVAATSPRTPLDYCSRIQSPRGLKNFDLHGVGLGIVAALDKTADAAAYEVLAKHSVCCTPKSDPIPVGSRCWKKGVAADEKIIESTSGIEILENYTYVTTRSGGCGKPCTKVYYDGGEIGRAVSVPGNLLEQTGYPSSDFLDCCHLCKKQLLGLDIYMYRGETAFCSSECRSRQIMMDEQQQKKKNKCRREVGRSVTVSGKSSSSPPMFSTGILAI